MEKISIECSNLDVGYDTDFRLLCPHLTLRGDIVAVLGHNGAGKSTLLKAVLKLLRPRSGSLAVSRASAVLAPEEHMAFCPETGAVFEDISVEDYVKLWCRLRHRQAAYYRREGAKYIELLGLEPLLPRLGRELSKGQRRSVQTAIGFLYRPQLFVFDEPFDGLDVQKTRELANLLKEHIHLMSFIISSHRMDVIERLADSALVLDRGDLLAPGSGRGLSVSLTDAMDFHLRSRQAA